ncbi:SH3-domain-containing protein [Backusella circina FSU 941]|nr:SH3-domain-containing protein [Backusella circina FSU 941]
MTPKIIGRVKAIYAFHVEEPFSLNFNKGDYIDVLAKLESGWWDGWCNGKRGWFPSNYVEPLPTLQRISSSSTLNSDTEPDKVIYIQDKKSSFF